MFAKTSKVRQNIQMKSVLVTGAGGQLGAALREAFPEADARTSAEFNVVAPPA